ncbi:MAG: transposase zinc-binding domain-containing protein [Saprospiraceae bacterium]|nr:transposase zinc-binding domain-containing protein [Saprospiraceae bacterium]
MRTQGYEVSDVITKFYGQIDETKTTAHQKRTLEAIAKCRTAALGGHIDSCDQCGHIRVSYNSCRNRHCPKCQGVEKKCGSSSKRMPCSPWLIFMWSLPFLMNLTIYACTILDFCTTCL